MKRILLASTALFALGAAASAADMSAPMVTKAPYVAPAFNWSGFYAGINLGGGFSDGSGSFATPVGAGSVTGSGSTFIYGGQIGYNWQGFGSPWVFGVEVDLQGTGGDGSGNGTVAGVPFSGSSSVDWFSTFRGRVGYAWDRTLVYVTGGGVYGSASTDVTGSLSGSASSDYVTWTVGAGVEQALWDRWSVKAEYLYIGTPDNSPLTKIPGVTAMTSGEVDTHVIRAGLNYRF